MHVSSCSSVPLFAYVYSPISHYHFQIYTTEFYYKLHNAKFPPSITFQSENLMNILKLIIINLLFSQFVQKIVRLSFNPLFKSIALNDTLKL